jgi:adhesin/invasin
MKRIVERLWSLPHGAGQKVRREAGARKATPRLLRRRRDALNTLRLFVVFAALAVLAATAANATVSGASFTTASSTTVQASTSQLADDLMRVNDGDGQSAAVGTAVATAPSVLVTDASDNPVAGVVVTFVVVSGGGSLTGATATTDDSGIATVGSWTLGTGAGANKMTATGSGISGAPVSFAATGVAGAAAKIVLHAGNAQSARVGTAVAIAPGVLVTDAYDNPVPGILVTFTVASGGGSVTGGLATSNTSGIATVGSWTLGTGAGANSLSASSAGLSGSPVTFTATGVAGVASKIALKDGNGQTDHVGTAVAVPPSVFVSDSYNNPISGVAVTFAVTSGGGSITGASTTSNAAGIATVGSWTLGIVPGPNSLTAASVGLTGSPITFTATGILGNPTKITLNAGNGQTATVGTAVATAPSVLVTDASNNPVSGVAITFSVASGGGSLTGGSTTTNMFGIASVGSWTLGTGAGANSLTATSVGLAGSPITFTATGVAGPATRYVVASSSYAPPAGSPVTITAQLADQYGNAVGTSGIPVTFSKTGTGGAFSGANPATTNASGIATITLTVASTVGTAYTVTATSTTPSTRTGTTPTMTTVAGPPSRIALRAGSGQTATAGTAVATAPSVLVTDAYNNPVPGVSVTFAVTSGGGSLSGAAATTNASGIATVGSWSLGTSAGANSLTATCAGLTGSPVLFTATGVAGPATRYVVTSSNYAPVAGTAVTITAQLADQYGNPVATSGIRVTFSRTGTGGQFSATKVNTNASGIATTTFTTSTTSGRTYTITARSTSPSSRTGTSPSIRTVPGPAAQIAQSAGNAQTATVGTPVATAPSVLVRDSHSNAVPGVVVTFAAASGGGSVTGASATTNASGIATVGSWTLGTVPGANSLRATCAGLTGSPVTFTATGLVGPATKFVVTSSSYAPAAGATVTITAQLADQYGNPVATSGIAVTFTGTPTTGVFGAPNPATTNASGSATITFATATTVGTVYTVTAASTSPSTRTGTSPTITTH